MKASVYTRYGDASVLAVQEIAKPNPEANEVRVKIHATTVTPVDTAFRQGNPWVARLFTGLFKPKNTVLGSEFSGVIDAIGSDVTRFKVGDAVFAATLGHGSHAEYICVAEDSTIALKPDALPFENAAAIGNGALTALPFLRDTGKIQPGQKVLIIGASGSIGTAAVQLAKAMGAHVTGVCSTPNLDLVRSLGADAVIDYTADDYTAGDATYDVIFDTAGKSTYWRCKARLSAGGRYLSPVMNGPTIGAVLWTSVFSSKKARFSATGLIDPAKKNEDLAYISGLIQDGRMDIVVGQTLPFAQIAEAHRHVEGGHKRGNLIITMA